MSMTKAIASASASETASLPVLVVDDSKAQRRLLAKALTKWGYDTIEAASGAEALSICAGVEIELVISDWLMPGMSGIEFCQAFRQLKQDRPGYFILLTAQTERQRLAEGLESGADDFLSKPFNVIELKARLRAGQRVIAAQRDMIAKNRLLRKTLDELEEAHAAIDRDLREARNFQQALVPNRHVALSGSDISFLYRPSGHVGGDLVGMFPVGESKCGIFAVDVSGHGIASALMTARVAGHLGGTSPVQNLALVADGSGGFRMRPPEDVCRQLNTLLVEELDLDKYLTMILAEYDLTTGRLSMAQAGHPSPLLQTRDGTLTFVESFGLPVGLIEGAEYAAGEVQLEPGDRLIIYSDGLTECPDPQGQLLDEDGLSEVVGLGRKATGGAFVDHLQTSLVQFAGHGEFPDDLSAVIIERHRAENAS